MAMKTVQVSVKEFAFRYGHSIRHVQKRIQDNVLYPQIRRVTKIANTYVLTVDKTWYESN
jgi:hypothetical protein